MNGGDFLLFSIEVATFRHKLERNGGPKKIASFVRVNDAADRSKEMRVTQFTVNSTD